MPKKQSLKQDALNSAKLQIKSVYIIYGLITY